MKVLTDCFIELINKKKINLLNNNLLIDDSSSTGSSDNNLSNDDLLNDDSSNDDSSEDKKSTDDEYGINNSPVTFDVVDSPKDVKKENKSIQTDKTK